MIILLKPPFYVSSVTCPFTMSAMPRYWVRATLLQCSLIFTNHTYKNPISKYVSVFLGCMSLVVTCIFLAAMCVE